MDPGQAWTQPDLFILEAGHGQWAAAIATAASGLWRAASSSIAPIHRGALPLFFDL
ncbi:MAG: hypothetical protein ACO331_09615 [Prochlorothrix sp.]